MNEVRADRVLMGAPRVLVLQSTPEFEENIDPRLKSDAIYLKRQQAWSIVSQVFAPVNVSHKSLHLRESQVPLWYTWFDANEGAYLFSRLYAGLASRDRKHHAPLKTNKIEDEIAQLPFTIQNESDFSAESYARELEAIQTREQLLGLRGPVPILLDPTAVAHEFGNYKSVYDCLTQKIDYAAELPPLSPTNHSLCFSDESPGTAIVVKASWRRVHKSFPLKRYATDAEGLRGLVASRFEWQGSEVISEPSADEIFEIQVPTGQRYQLVGFHIMAKLQRDWTWITLWWSDEPQSDFGEDRPAGLAALPFHLSQYKMCTVTGFASDDETPSPALREKFASFAAAFDETRAINGAATWCSNPYIEKGHNNARTNCLGCHQQAGSMNSPDSILIADEFFPQQLLLRSRNNFASDYYWAFRQLKSGADPLPLKMRDLTEAIDLVGDDPVKRRALLRKAFFERGF